MKKNTIQGAKLFGRLMAYLFDIIFIAIWYVFVAGAITIVTGEEKMMLALRNPRYGDVYTPYRVALMALPIVMFIHCFIGESSKRESSLGKRMMGLRVVRKDAGKARIIDIMARNAVKILPLVFAAMFPRTKELVIIVPIIAVSVLYILIPLFGRNHRAIHDFISGCIVVRKNELLKVRAGVVEEVKVIPPIQIELPKPVIIPEVVEEPKPEVEPEVPKEPIVESIPEPIVEKVVISAVDDEDKTIAPVAYILKLTGVSGQYEGASLPLDSAITLGRDVEKCDLIFAPDTPGVSKVHCRVEVKNSKVILVDLNSSYGTMLNGTTRLLAGTEYELKQGDRFTIGQSEEFVIQ